MKRKNVGIIALVIGIGVVNASVLYIVELIGVDGTAWLWNDVLNTDTNRWLVLPTAVALGLVLTFVFQQLKVKRVEPPVNDLMTELNGAPASIDWLGKVIVIGCLSLLAGASLGPEASLMMASASIGAFAAKKWQFASTKEVFVLASIGALLVAFVESLILVLIPLLVLLQAARKQKKRPELLPIAMVVVAALASYVAIWLIYRMTGQEGTDLVPTLPAFAPRDFAVAAVLGFIGGFISFAILWLIERCFRIAKRVDGWRVPAASYMAATVFAIGVGVLYLIGGPTVQFSGSFGAHELLQSGVQYGALALLVMLVAKVLVIAWSKGTGYWGGLVFPSVYIGVALGLLTGAVFPELGGAGAIIGGMCGMVAAALGSPIMAAIFLASVLPFGPLWAVAVCAVLGAAIYSKLQSRFVKVLEQRK